jgi:hypothetical protein
MPRVPEDQRMQEPFRDPAVPDGATSMADTWRSGDAAGAGTGGGEGRAGTQTYYAACQDCPGSGTSGGWIGPNRGKREEAQADADEHNRTHEGHTAGVVAF